MRGQVREISIEGWRVWQSKYGDATLVPPSNISIIEWSNWLSFSQIHCFIAFISFWLPNFGKRASNWNPSSQRMSPDSSLIGVFTSGNLNLIWSWNAMGFSMVWIHRWSFGGGCRLFSSDGRIGVIHAVNLAVAMDRGYMHRSAKVSVINSH